MIGLLKMVQLQVESDMVKELANDVSTACWVALSQGPLQLTADMLSWPRRADPEVVEEVVERGDHGWQ